MIELVGFAQINLVVLQQRVGNPTCVIIRKMFACNYSQQTFFALKKEGIF